MQRITSYAVSAHVVEGSVRFRTYGGTEHRQLMAATPLQNKRAG